MMPEKMSSEKMKFQLERMILFSDAVFAIAITLLIIDLKVPELEGNVTNQALTNALARLTPNIIGFLLSFLLIGLYWTVHHRLFGYVTGYTPFLLWLNLLFLLGIISLPFTTAFYSAYFHTALRTPLILYAANFCYIGILSNWMHRYVTSQKRNLTEGLTNEMARYYSFRAIMIPVIFALIIFISFFSTMLALFIPPLTPLIVFVLSGIYKRKNRLVQK